MSDQPAAEPARFRSRAVSRSVDPAREAAEARVQRFLDAALELLNSPSGDDFTVQNVVDRSGLSLRSFYHHFAGKYELLLALFEEAIRTTADYLADETQAVDDPLGRLRVFTTEYYRLCRSGRRRNSDQRLPSRAVGQFAHQLLYEHPQEAAQAFTPLVSLFRQLLDEAALAGTIQSGRDHEQVAGLVLQAIMFNAFSTTITGSKTDDVAGRGDLLWDLLVHGLAPRNE